MKQITTLLVGCGISLFASSISIAETIQFDLAGVIISQTKSIEEGSHSIEFINLAPGNDYQVEQKTEYMEIAGLPQNVTPPSPKSDPADKNLANEDCGASVSNEIAKLKAEKDESNVPLLLKTIAAGDCKNEELERNLVIKSTKKVVPFVIKKGQKVTISIKRGDGASKKEWSYTIETGVGGKFVASWGLAVLPDQNEDFFTKQTDSGSYLVTEKSDSGGVELIPAVFYTWISNSSIKNGRTHGPTMGLGLDQDNLSAFIGYNLTFRQRLGISAGVAVHKQDRLLGEYEIGQELSENIPVLTEETYQVNGFVSLIYSFE